MQERSDHGDASAACVAVRRRIDCCARAGRLQQLGRQHADDHGRNVREAGARDADSNSRIVDEGTNTGSIGHDRDNCITGARPAVATGTDPVPGENAHSAASAHASACRADGFRDNDACRTDNEASHAQAARNRHHCTRAKHQGHATCNGGARIG
jgi:hypothetical protein